MVPILKAFAFTVLVEAAAAFLLGMCKAADFLLLFCVNLITNPPLNFLLDWLWLRGLFPGWGLLAALELAAFLAEALLYRKRLSYARLSPFWLSLILNGISFVGGFFLA